MLQRAAKLITTAVNRESHSIYANFGLRGIVTGFLAGTTATGVCLLEPQSDAIDERKPPRPSIYYAADTLNQDDYRLTAEEETFLRRPIRAARLWLWSQIDAVDDIAASVIDPINAGYTAVIEPIHPSERTFPRAVAVPSCCFVSAILFRRVAFKLKTAAWLITPILTTTLAFPRSLERATNNSAFKIFDLIHLQDDKPDMVENGADWLSRFPFLSALQDFGIRDSENRPSLPPDSGKEEGIAVISTTEAGVLPPPTAAMGFGPSPEEIEAAGKIGDENSDFGQSSQEDRDTYSSRRAQLKPS